MADPLKNWAPEPAPLPWLASLHPASWLIGLVVVLWPVDIGPEFPESLPSAPPAAAAEAPATRPPAAPQAKDRGSLAQFATRRDEPIDREAFIAAFRRQARAAALPCLLQWRPSPASLFVAATLVKAGRLRNFRPIGAEAAAPDCLAPAVAAMDFTPLAAPLANDAQELQWRIDW